MSLHRFLEFQGRVGLRDLPYLWGELFTAPREEHKLSGDTSRFDPQYAPLFYSGFESNYKNIILEFFEVFQVGKNRFPMIKWGFFYITFNFKVNRLLRTELTLNKTPLTSHCRELYHS